MQNRSKQILFCKRGYDKKRHLTTRWPDVKQPCWIYDDHTAELRCSWPSRASKKNSVGIFEYILASMLKVYLDVF